MVAPVMLAPGPPDMQVHTMAMPHTMVYAPNVSNEDIGAAPDLARPATSSRAGMLYPDAGAQQFTLSRPAVCPELSACRMQTEATLALSSASSSAILSPVVVVEVASSAFWAGVSSPKQG